MPPSFRRPRSAGGVTLSLIGCLAMPGTAAALADLFAWSRWVPLVTLVVALVASSQLVLTARVWRAASLPVKAVALVASTSAVLWMVAMMYAPRLTVLAARGEPVFATVVRHDATYYPGRGGGHHVHCYELRRTDDTPIFGTVCRDRPDEFTVGQSLTVLVDPSNLIASETPDAVAGASFWQVLGLASSGAALVLCWVTGVLLTRPPSATRRRGRHSLD